VADQGIKKAIVLSENLPNTLQPINQYVIRYRIVSEDRNRRSHWSPLYYIELQEDEES
jgi:hypothetical protein